MTDTPEALPPLPHWAMRDAYQGVETHWYSADQMRDYARAALAQRQQVPEDKWEGAEEWMPLAWELCADECGEEACNELVWEGGAVPEPWGDRWLKYEGEAKRLIALVRKHVPAITAAPSAQAEPVAWQARLKDEPGAEWWDCSAEWARMITEGKGSFALLETRPLYAAPPSAQAEPQVPLSFNSAQRRRLWDNSPEVHADANSFAAFERIVQLVESAHSIGKQESK